MLLGLISIIVYDPITTVAAAIAANEPPLELIGNALPMTLIFTCLMAIVISMIYQASFSNFFIILITCFVVVGLLGLNISIIGLVSFSGSTVYLILKLFLLVLTINTVYVMAVITLTKTFSSKLNWKILSK